MVFSGWKLAGETTRTQDVQIGVIGVLGAGLGTLVLARTSNARVIFPLQTRYFIQYTGMGLCLGACSMGLGYIARKWWDIVNSKLIK